MRFVELPARNLARRPARSLLTLLGIAVAVGSLVALVGLAHGFGNAWLTSLNERKTQLVAVQKGIVEILTSSLPQATVARLRQVEGVTAANGALLGLVPAEQDYTLLFAGWSEDDPEWRNLTYVAGRAPAAGEEAVVVLGEVLAEALNKHPGDSLRLLYRPFRVVGVARFGNAINNNMALSPLAQIQALLHREGTVTLIHLRLAQAERPDVVAATTARLKAAVPDAAFTATGDLAEQNVIVGLLDAIAWATSAIALFMGTVIVANTLMMTVAERTTEFGVLSAIGWSPARILAMVLLEGLMLGAAGGLVGCVAGVAAAYWIATLPVIGGFLDPQVTPTLVGEVFVAVVALSGLGGLYPAWRASRAQPAEALRRG
jgi:putative ABC transport system permease protein